MVLACDPGVKNFGVATFYEQRRSWLLEDSILYDNLITELTDENYQDQVKQFLYEWNTRFAAIGNLALTEGILVMERFQPRGHKSNIIEKVNVMIGLLTGWAMQSGWEVKLVTPAIWKNAFHRKFPGRELADYYKEVKATPHQVDAALIGRYAIDKFEKFILTKSFRSRIEWS